jgi:hypothetical protein
VQLEVGGSVLPSLETLDVRVDLTNRGPAAPSELTLHGELFGHADEARLDQGIPPGQTRSLLLRFPVGSPRPGLHALVLRIGYLPGTPGGGASAERVTQPGYLLIALGARSEPALRVTVPAVDLSALATLPVALESLDGAPHRARLRIETSGGIKADGPAEADVPARGRALVPFELRRVGAPRGTPQGVLVVAAAAEGPEEKTTVATGVVRVAPDRAWMPRLCAGLLAVGLLLLAVAVALEARRALARG